MYVGELLSAWGGRSARASLMRQVFTERDIPAGGEMRVAQGSIFTPSARDLARERDVAIIELAPHEIRVNAVSPGPIETPIFTKMGLPESALPEMAADFTAKNPMKRFGQPEEVAQAALFLGFEATYTTGAELPVDGGFSQL